MTNAPQESAVEANEMKKAILCLFILFTMIVLPSCSNNLTNYSAIISLFQNHEDSFIEASISGDFSKLEEIRGVQKVSTGNQCVDIQCGGTGFGSSTHYYGIFYSEADDLCAIDVAGPRDELVADGNGYRYQQHPGDNEYYVEPLGNHFFYYEAHF